MATAFAIAIFEPCGVNSNVLSRTNLNPNQLHNQARAQRQRVAAEKEKQGRRSMWRCLCRHMNLRPCFDVVHQGNPNPNQRLNPKRRSPVRSPFRKGRRTQRMCSFRGSYANRGNGTELSSSDVVRVTGVEPARLAAREPKSRMSANSIIPACILLSFVLHIFSAHKT